MARWGLSRVRGVQSLCLGAMQVLDSAGKRIEHLHYDDEMIIMDRFRVGGSPSGPEIALEVTVRFHADHRIESLSIHPRDEDAFDAAVDAFLLTTEAESSVGHDSSPNPKLPRGGGRIGAGEPGGSRRCLPDLTRPKSSSPFRPLVSRLVVSDPDLHGR
jgi:hypothetical protein